MKSSIKQNALIFASFGLILNGIGCGNGTSTPANSSPAFGQQALETLQEQGSTQTASLQNPAGCLDISKLYALMTQAKQTRTTLLDAVVQSKNGAPTPLFFATLLKEYSPSADDKTEPGKLVQTGCDSVSYIDADGKSEGTFKFVKSSPTKILMTISNDDSSQTSKLSMDLIADGKVLITQSFPISTLTCSAKDVETHQAAISSLTEFGDTLGAAPTTTTRLQDMTALAAKAPPVPDGLSCPITPTSALVTSGTI